jgi:hypothetical protein
VIADHQNERLGRSDVILILFRRMWRDKLTPWQKARQLTAWAKSERVGVTSRV